VRPLHPTNKPPFSTTCKKNKNAYILLSSMDSQAWRDKNNPAVEACRRHTVLSLTGVGKVAAEKLSAAGVNTIGDILDNTAKVRTSGVRGPDALISKAERYIQNHLQQQGISVTLPTMLSTAPASVLAAAVTTEQAAGKDSDKYPTNKEHRITSHSWYKQILYVPLLETPGRVAEGVAWELTFETVGSRVAVVCQFKVGDDLCTEGFSPQVLAAINLGMPLLTVRVRKSDVCPEMEALVNALDETAWFQDRDHTEQEY